MTNDDSAIEMLKRIGSSLGIVGIAGAALGLGIAAFAGPIVLGAVAAEISVDLAMGAAGVLLNKYANRIAPKLAKIDFVSKSGFFSKDNNKLRSVGKTVGGVVLATSPLEFVVGFAIVGFAKPLDIAAVVATALPCAAIGIGGLVYDRIARHRKAAAQVRIAQEAVLVRDEMIAQKPAVELNSEGGSRILKMLLRNPEQTRRHRSRV